jgi:hypothetical protein
VASAGGWLKAVKNEQTAATNTFNETRQKAEADLKRAKKIARVAFDGNNALNLKEINIVRFEDWLSDAEKFYANLLGNPQWLATMQNYGYTSETFTALQQEATSLKTLQETQ